MIDDLTDLAAAVVVDVAADNAAKKRRWLRILRGIAGLLFLALMVVLVYVTIRYS